MSTLWWLPGNPQHTLVGELNISRKSFSTLDIVGTFIDLGSVENLNRYINRPEAYDVICGNTVTGEQVTLLGCTAISSSIGTGIPRATFAVTYVLFKHHFADEQGVTFNKVSIKFLNIEDWTRISGFSSRFNRSEEQFKNHIIEYSFPKIWTAEVEGRTITIEFELNSQHRGINEIVLHQSTYVKIKFPEHRSIQDILSTDIYYLQNFFSLGLGVPVFPIEIIGNNASIINELSDAMVVPQNIIVFYSNKEYSGETKIHPSNILFQLADLGDNWARCISNWFRRYEIIKPAIDLYSANLYGGNGAYLETSFLGMCQALEAYHRRVLNGTYIKSEDYSLLYDTLVSAIPHDLDSEFNVSLREKMKYFNEYSLRKRLKQLLGRNWNLYRNYIKDKNEFIDAVVTTRNYHTHYDDELRARAISGRELLVITEKLKMILEICFLQELGIPEQQVSSILQSTYRYHYLAEIQ